VGSLWLVLSLIQLSRLAYGWIRVHRDLEPAPLPRSRRGRVAFTAVFGPAVIGLLRPQIILPDWSRALPVEFRRWVYRHEAAHLRAGDLWLHYTGHLLVAAAPWNPGLWLLRQGLARALETDCDRRVLCRHADVRGYAETLLTVANFRAGPGLALGTFHPRVSSLEHRIRTMTTRPLASLGMARLSAMSLALSLAFLVACEMPTPTEIQPARSLRPAEAPVQPVRDNETGAIFTPYTVAPDIVNRLDVQKALEAEYPDDLREAGVGGTANVWLFVDETGIVTDTRIQRSSGNPKLDTAALKVAGLMRFTPARNKEEPVAVWIAIPLTFQIR
jgi:TonB family protein